MKLRPNRTNMNQNHGMATAVASSRPRIQFSASRRRRASADRIEAMASVRPHSTKASGPLTRTAMPTRTYPGHWSTRLPRIAATASSAAPPKTPAVKRVSRMAYRDNAKMPGLALRNRPALMPTVRDAMRRPNHIVMPISTSDASAGTRRAASSVGPIRSMARPCSW